MHRSAFRVSAIRLLAINAALLFLICGIAQAQLPSDSPAAPPRSPSASGTGAAGLSSDTPTDYRGSAAPTGQTASSRSGDTPPSAPPPSPNRLDTTTHATNPIGSSPTTSSTGAPNGIDTAGTHAATVPHDSAATPAHESTPAVDTSRPSVAVTGADFPRLAPEEYTDIDGLPFFTLHGQLPYRETHISVPTLSVFGGALLVLAGGITWYQQAWYPDSTKGPFHFQVDWGYAREMDKIGHAFGGWMSAYCSYESFIASGMSKHDAEFWGPIGGLFFQTYMEVQDGFHSNYGFDVTDEIGNIAGVAYFYAQRKIPFLQNFDFKMSIGVTGRDSLREASQIRSRLLFDDYDRQNMWLSFRVHNLLPENLKPYWPKWLQLAIGTGARDVELLNGFQAYRTLFISLDYNLKELLPNLGSFGNWLVQGFNAFHLPAPALQLHPKVKFLILFPITL